MTEPREGRGRTQVRDPSQAIAMAKCWLATWVRRAGPISQLQGLPEEGSFHPEKCAYCDMPRDFLVQMLEEFRDWSGISQKIGDFEVYEDAPLRLAMESFMTLPADEQTRLVRKAQVPVKEEEEEPPHDPRSPW